MKGHIHIQDQGETIDVDLAQRQLAVHHRYEWLHILNDFALAAWFVVGSILFFYGRFQHLGTWLFLLGSAQMMLGPVLRVAHKVHLGRLGAHHLGI